MTVIKYQAGKNEIYNKAGLQAHGSFAADLEGLNPKELLESSIGLCVSITLIKILERDNVPLDDALINVEVTAQKNDSKENRFSNFTVKIDFPLNLEPEYKKKLMDSIERGCTISNTLKNISIVKLICNNEE